MLSCRSPDRAECARRLTLHLARAYLPMPVSSLRSALLQLRRRGGLDASASIDSLFRTGELRHETIDGLDYAWPADFSAEPGGVSNRVRLVAPFDPVVWDRKRFERLWGWPYRFEAYTPAERRRFGYYAIPMLLGDRAIGWARCTLASGRLDVSVHFAHRAHRGKAFCQSLESEAARMATMLGARITSISR